MPLYNGWMSPPFSRLSLTSPCHSWPSTYSLISIFRPTLMGLASAGRARLDLRRTETRIGSSPSIQNCAGTSISLVVSNRVPILLCDCEVQIEDGERIEDFRPALRLRGEGNADQ